MKAYGVQQKSPVSKEWINEVSAIRKEGFVILKKVFSEVECKNYSDRLDAVLKTQELEFERKILEEISEADMARAPFLYDEVFLKMLSNEKVLSLVQQFLGEKFIIHLQNGIVNKPSTDHHQSSWHRDLPYQEYTTSKPLAISVLVCLDSFSPETGGTLLLPKSHKLEEFPDEEYIFNNALQPKAEPGDVIVFDSMVFHRAGENTSTIIRRGINHMYVRPILKQQIDIPKAFSGKFKDDKVLYGLLDYEYSVPESVIDFRKKKMNKLRS